MGEYYQGTTASIRRFCDSQYERVQPLRNAREAVKDSSMVTYSPPRDILVNLVDSSAKTRLAASRETPRIALVSWT
jgi:hypothetical protein